VPIVSIIDFNPLCPPWVPSFLSLIEPSGMLKSSTTITFFVSLWETIRRTSATAMPERFMKVDGFTVAILKPFPVVPIVMAALSACRKFVCVNELSIKSTTLKPMLWRFLWYSSPGLPKPNMQQDTFSGPVCLFFTRALKNESKDICSMLLLCWCCALFCAFCRCCFTGSVSDHCQHLIRRVLDGKVGKIKVAYVN